MYIGTSWNKILILACQNICMSGQEDLKTYATAVKTYMANICMSGQEDLETLCKCNTNLHVKMHVRSGRP